MNNEVRRKGGKEQMRSTSRQLKLGTFRIKVRQITTEQTNLFIQVRLCQKGYKTKEKVSRKYRSFTYASTCTKGM